MQFSVAAVEIGDMAEQTHEQRNRVAQIKKSIALMLNFGSVNAFGAHECLYAAMTKQDPTSAEWLLIVREMRKLERRMKAGHA